VLDAVLARTRGKEQAAAQALLDQLLGYAQDGPAGEAGQARSTGPAPGRPPGATAGPRRFSARR
jgi:hypothetical protein